MKANDIQRIIATIIILCGSLAIIIMYPDGLGEHAQYNGMAYGLAWLIAGGLVYSWLLDKKDEDTDAKEDNNEHSH